MPFCLEGVPEIDSVEDAEKEGAILDFPIDFKARLYQRCDGLCP